MTTEFKLVPVELLEGLSALWPDGASNDGSGRIGWAPHVTKLVDELRSLLASAPASPQAAQPVAWQYRHRFEEDGEVEIGLWQHCEQKIYDLLQGRKNTDTRQLFTSSTVPAIYDEAKERELFEEVQGEDGGNIDRDSMGYYENPYVQSAWDGWLACAQSRAKAVEVGHEK